jgi:hypothetical protein
VFWFTGIAAAVIAVGLAASAYMIPHDTHDSHDAHPAEKSPGH